MVLPPDHMWWLNGGSGAYFSSYLPKQLAANAGLYDVPLDNPDITKEERFTSFVTQCMDAIDLRYKLSYSFR